MPIRQVGGLVVMSSLLLLRLYTPTGRYPFLQGAPRRFRMAICRQSFNDIIAQVTL